MIRLHFVVEGQTEETFVRDLLAEDLAAHNVIADVHRITTGRKQRRPYRGGLVSYAHIRRDIALWASQDRRSDARFTSMIDLYQLPADFPGYRRGQQVTDPIQRVTFLEAEFGRDLNETRFIPYIQLHEFEAMLFSAPSAFDASFPGRKIAIDRLQSIRDEFQSPEWIDDGESTSPAQRICALFPDYQKPVFGALIAATIGLHSIARECPHFASWLNTLRSLR